MDGQRDHRPGHQHPDRGPAVIRLWWLNLWGAGVGGDVGVPALLRLGYHHFEQSPIGRVPLVPETALLPGDIPARHPQP